jgi:hypothetical protein
MTYRVEPVAYEDARGLTQTMTRAMYEDDHYALLFNRIPVEQIAEDSAKRVPKNLTGERDIQRHEKVIHVETGEIVGYARWFLPDHLKGSTIWPETQMRPPTEKEEKLFQENYATTVENGRRRIMNYDMAFEGGMELQRIFDELMQNGPYLGITLPTIYCCLLT